MEIFEKLAWEMEVSRIQGNKMRNVDGDTLEEALHEEQQAMMTLGMARQVRQLVRHLYKPIPAFPLFHLIDLKYS